MPKREFIRQAILGIILAGLLISAYALGHATAQPYCPTEDSCSASYYHGGWYIHQVIP